MIIITIIGYASFFQRCLTGILISFFFFFLSINVNRIESRCRIEMRYRGHLNDVLLQRTLLLLPRYIDDKV